MNKNNEEIVMVGIMTFKYEHNTIVVNLNDMFMYGIPNILNEIQKVFGKRKVQLNFGVMKQLRNQWNENLKSTGMYDNFVWVENSNNNTFGFQFTTKSNEDLEITLKEKLNSIRDCFGPERFDQYVNQCIARAEIRPGD